MDEYIKAMNSFNDMGQHIGSAAASCYNRIIEGGVPDHHAAMLTQTFIISLFRMMGEVQQKRNTGESSPSQD